MNDPDDITTFEINHYYANQFFSTAEWLRRKNDLEKALVLFEKGLAFYPGAAFAYSDMGAMAGQLGYLRLASELFSRGIEVDPAYFPNYVNLAHVYWLQGEGDKGLECYRSAGERVRDLAAVETQRSRFEKTLAAPRPKSIDKTTAEYERFSDGLTHERAFLLAGMTRSAMEIKAP
jgi:tetratricopeptide (TPR) repeat protein